jgi:hypothetical protein
MAQARSSARNRWDETAVVYLLAIPVLGVLMGGLYALPILSLTRGKEPYTTATLAASLALPLLAIGWVFRTHASWIIGEWLVAMLLLLLRRARGPLDGNIERFGIVNCATCCLAVAVGFLTRTGVLPASLVG